MNHPIIEETVRPYRLWHWKGKKYLPHRNYNNAFRAVIGAWVWQKKFGKINDTIEVIDVRTAKLIGQYKRTPTSVTFHKENKRVINEAIATERPQAVSGNAG
jgi:hypothetical protein